MFVNAPIFRNSYEDDQLFEDLLVNLQKMDSLPTVEQSYMAPSTIVIETPWSEFGKSRSPRSTASSPLSSDSSTNSSKKSRKRSLDTVSSVVSVASSSLSEEEGSVSNQSSTVSLVQQKVINIPRIVKNDIRRKISFMFANVMNSNDFTLLDSFFRKFCTPDVELSKKSHASDPLGLCTVQLPGMDLVVSYFGALGILTPDCIVTIGETKIKQSVNAPGCELISNFSFHLTKFYDAPPSKVAQFILRQHQSRANGRIKDIEGSVKRSIKRAKKFEVNSYASYETTKLEIEQDEDYQSFFSQFDAMNVRSAMLNDEFPRLQVPVSLKLNGSLTFKINDQKRITAINMVPFTMEATELSL